MIAAMYSAIPRRQPFHKGHFALVVIPRTHSAPPAGSGAVLRWESSLEGGPAYIRVAFGTRHAPGTLPTGELLRSVARSAMSAKPKRASPGIEYFPSLPA